MNHLDHTEILTYLGLRCFFMLLGKRKLSLGQAGLPGKGITPGAEETMSSRAMQEHPLLSVSKTSAPRCMTVSHLHLPWRNIQGVE